MKTNYVLVDYENVQVKSLDLLREEHFRVTVFLGPNNTRLPVELVLAMQQLGERAQYVTLETPGSNALDFHIAYYLGALAKEDPSGFFHNYFQGHGVRPADQAPADPENIFFPLRVNRGYALLWPSGYRVASPNWRRQCQETEKHQSQNGSG